jgi:hypothetical protein
MFNKDDLNLSFSLSQFLIHQCTWVATGSTLSVNWKDHVFPLSCKVPAEIFVKEVFIAFTQCHVSFWLTESLLSRMNLLMDKFLSFKRPEFQILIKIMDRVFKKNISQIWKLLEKLKNSIFSHWLLFIHQVRSLNMRFLVTFCWWWICCIRLFWQIRIESG